MIDKIISGGQTGADRAALDIAIKFGITHGGWCPRGRMAEDGILPDHYLLTCPLDANSDINEPDIYSERTKLNIRDSDGTLIFLSSFPLLAGINNGTRLTITEAERSNKPHHIVDLSKNQSVQIISDWIEIHHISVLNIAGPRESQCPGIYQHVYRFLEKLFSESRQMQQEHPTAS